MTRAGKKAGLTSGWQFGFFISFTLCWVFVCAPIAHAGEFAGQVVGVTDGDTLTVRKDGVVATKIRLWGIDAPEKRQAFSNSAKRHLSTLAYGKRVKVLVRDTDRYGRTVAEIILADGRNVNQEMVKAGYAWWFRHYAPYDRVLERLEGGARNAKRGLWADPYAVPPWEFRKVRRGR